MFYPTKNILYIENELLSTEDSISQGKDSIKSIVCKNILIYNILSLGVVFFFFFFFC